MEQPLVKHTGALQAIAARVQKWLRPNPGRRSIRVIVIVNLLIVLEVMLEDRLTGGASYRALKRAGLADVVGLATQVWVVGSTLLASGLFISDLLRKPTATTEPHCRRRGLAVNGAFLAAWWVILAAICAYAFALGHAG